MGKAENEPKKREKRVGFWSCFFAFVALVVLASTSFGLSFVHMGVMNTPIALMIAFVKAAIVAVIFMELADQPASHAIVACTAFVFVCILMSLVIGDVLTRGEPHARVHAMHSATP